MEPDRSVHIPEAIANSNMLKLLYMCNSFDCIWTNNMAALRLGTRTATRGYSR